MLGKVQKVATEVGVAVTVGAGYLLLKNRSSRIPAEFQEYEYLSQTDFPYVIPKFKALCANEEEYVEFVHKIEHMLELASRLQKKESIPGGQFQLNRLSQSVCRDAELLCYRARGSNDADVLEAAIDCERDELEILKSHCENTLRNVLLH